MKIIFISRYLYVLPDFPEKPVMKIIFTQNPLTFLLQFAKIIASENEIFNGFTKLSVL